MSIYGVIALQKEIRARVSDPRYQSDPAFRKETEAKLQRAYGDQPFEIVRYPGGFKR